MSRRILSLTLAAGIVAPALATGPKQQIVANGRSTGTDAVVEIRPRGGGTGTGTVIWKSNNGGGADEWVAVLSAAHNFTDAANNLVRGGHKIRFGTARDGLSTQKGGLGSSWAWNHPTIDVGILAVKWGAADAAFNALTPATRAPWTPGAGTAVADPQGLGRTMNVLPSSVFNQFTEVGYGGTGKFVAGGMDAQRDVIILPNGAKRYNLHLDHEKRFQNNTIDWTWTGANTSGRAGESYKAIEFDMDLVAAGTPPFLQGEGLSFAGDSGGPYFSYAGPLGMEQVIGFDRPGGLKWGAGDGGPAVAMPIATNMLIGVHTYGNSRPGGAGMSPTFFNPYGRMGGGVPLTPQLNAFIDQRLGYVPAPGTAALLTLGGVLALRRRRPE